MRYQLSWQSTRLLIVLSQVRLLYNAPLWGVRLMVRTPGFHPGNRGSIPLRPTKIFVERFPSGQRDQTVNLPAQPSKVRILLSPPSAALAHLVEQLTCNQQVIGSTPISGTIYLCLDSSVGQSTRFIPERSKVRILFQAPILISTAQ